MYLFQCGGSLVGQNGRVAALSRGHSFAQGRVALSLDIIVFIFNYFDLGNSCEERFTLDNCFVLEGLN